MSSRPLTTDQRRQLWTRAQPDGDGDGPARLRPPRVSYDLATVAVRITHPGGGTNTAAVYAHDLSAGGLSFLYAGFLHGGTAVDVALRRRGGGEAVAHGSVAWCKHVGGPWHGVGVKFGQPIAPDAFVDPTAFDPKAGDPAVVPGSRRDLSGRLLYLEDQELDQALFLHTVRRTRLGVTTVADAPAAVAAAAAGSFDVVCVDLNLGTHHPTGEQAMSQLRAAGYAGPFVVVSGDTPDRLARARATGGPGTLVLSKPYDGSKLLATLASALAIAAAASASDAAPLCSELAGQDGIAPLLRGFRDKVHSAAVDLDRLMHAVTRPGGPDDRSAAAVRLLCQTLRGAGRGYGYPAVSAAADAALGSLEAGDPTVEHDLRALQAVCRRVAA